MENLTTHTVVHHHDSHHDEDEDDDDKIWTSTNTMSVVIYSVVCVLGVSGNGVVIWATTGSRMKRTVSTVWYLNLAVADFLVTALLPLSITENALGDGHWPFGRFACKMDGLLFHVNMCASVFTLAVISVDRCVGVVCPLWARCSGHRTVRTASRVSLGVWVLALALSSPSFIFRDTRPVSPETVWCHNNYALAADYSNRTAQEIQLHKFRFRATVVATFVVGFLLPFSVIVSCYSVIVYRLRNNIRQSGRSFRIVATVIVAFFLCWLPFHIILLIFVANYPKVSENTLTGLALYFGVPVTRALALVNSCLNPLLYVFMGQGFKDVFRRSIVKVLEKAFAEETDAEETDNTPTDPDVTQMITLSEIRG